VINLCQIVFGYPVEKGIQIAKEVHAQKRVIIYSGSLEVVEFKQEQVHAFGPDPLIQRSQGSMTAVIGKAV
jgi:ATP-dependent Clp protease adaptor protein ClpS